MSQPLFWPIIFIFFILNIWHVYKVDECKDCSNNKLKQLGIEAYISQMPVPSTHLTKHAEWKPCLGNQCI